jgi:uncharacterized membrane protein
MGVSGNGLVIAGYCTTAADSQQAVKWNTSGNVTTLAFTGSASATGVNIDGTVIVGTVVGADTYAAAWSGVLTPTLYGDLGTTPTAATRVNANGTIIVGWQQSPWKGVYWDATAALGGAIAVNPTNLPYVFNRAQGVSADGKVIVGKSMLGPQVVGFRWEAGTATILPHYGSSIASSAEGVSDDATVTVGTSGGVAVRWIGTSSPALLWSAGSANSASQNGRIIVGAGGGEATFSNSGNNGQTLSSAITSLGVNLGAWTLSTATDVSDNGTVIVGWGTNGATEGAWMVNLAGTGIAGL